MFTVGDRLRKAREKTGLDQEQFAREIGVSRGTVSNYERHAGPPSELKRPYLLAWALGTDVPIEWIEGGDGHHGSPPPRGGEPVSPAATPLAELTEAKRARSRRGGSTGRYLTHAA